MKRFILLAAMMISLITTAQIQVTESKTEDIYKARMGAIRLTKFTSEEDGVHYAFYFRNAEYKQIVDFEYISFNDTTEVKEFFETVIKAIDEKNEFDVVIGNQDITIRRGMAQSVYISNRKGYCYVSRKEAEAIISSL